MPINFDELVLGPSVDVFGIPIVLTPTASQPGQPAYSSDVNGNPLLAIWSVKDVDVMLNDGALLATKTLELGIQYSRFSVPPRRGDGVQITLTEFMIAQLGQAPVNRGFANPANYTIDQVRPDGQGGARILLKALQS